MDINTAINTLVQAVQVAQTKGAYNLQEAAALYEAIKSLAEHTKQQENTNEVEHD